MITDKKNKIIIISSPSGAGKTTICKFLLKKLKNVDLSFSYTTRNMRLIPFYMGKVPLDTSTPL